MQECLALSPIVVGRALFTGPVLMSIASRLIRCEQIVDQPRCSALPGLSFPEFCGEVKTTRFHLFPRHPSMARGGCMDGARARP